MKKLVFAVIVLGCMSGSAMASNMEGIVSSKELMLDFFKNKREEILEARSFCCSRIKDVRKNVQQAIKEGYCDGVFADKCKLALECFNDFENQKNESSLLKTLISITNNGFYDSSNFYISTRFKEDLYTQKAAISLLDSTWTLLWQMREVMDVTLVASDSDAFSDLLRDRIFVSSFLADRFDTENICCLLEDEAFAQ